MNQHYDSKSGEVVCEWTENMKYRLVRVTYTYHSKKEPPHPSYRAIKYFIEVLTVDHMNESSWRECENQTINVRCQPEAMHALLNYTPPDDCR